MKHTIDVFIHPSEQNNHTVTPIILITMIAIIIINNLLLEYKETDKTNRNVVPNMVHNVFDLAFENTVTRVMLYY